MERLTYRDSEKMTEDGLIRPSYSDYPTRRIIERLAEYEDLEDRLNGISIQQVVDGFVKTIENQTHEGYEHGRILTNEEANQWNEYRQLDEQGLLLRLPCKVGDTLYQPIYSSINEYKVIGLCFDIHHNKWMYEVAYETGSEWHKTVCDFNYIGKTVFLTKAEAEQKLKETEEKEENGPDLF